MKFSIITLLASSLAVSASASVIRRQNPVPCCFTILAQGTVNGHVGENAEGEIGVGGSFSQSMYCVSDGIFTDYNGQPCSILSSNGQFVCEPNSTPTSSKFMFAPNGDLLYETDPSYFACPSSSQANNGGYNIFSGNTTNNTGCTSITLLTGGFSCAVLGRPPSSTIKSSSTSIATSAITPGITTASEILPVVTATATKTLTTTATTSCPTDISAGRYVAPSLIIPVSPLYPDYPFFTQYNATITPVNNTVFAFDIPDAYSGNCALIFLFPFGDDAQFPYSFSGIEEEEQSHGGLDFALLDGKATNPSTFNSLPPILNDYGKTEVVPGHNYTISVGPCAGGKSVAYEVSTVGEVALQYFQSIGGNPIGLWVVPCA